MYDFEELDYYELLGVARTASSEELKRAYRQQMTRYHPDRYAAAGQAERTYAELRAQRINEAYRVLSDFASRSAYNRGQPAGASRRTPLRDEPIPATAPAQGSAYAAPDRPRDQQAELYDMARAHLDAGRHMQAVAVLRQLQQLNPFYRDTAALLERAEQALRSQEPASPRAQVRQPAGSSSSRGRQRLIVLGLGGLLITSLLTGALMLLRGQAPANTAPSPAGVAVASTDLPAPTEPPPTRLPAAAPPTAAPPTALPTTVPPIIPPTAAPSPTITATSSPTVTPPGTALASIELEQGELLRADNFSSPGRWATASGNGWSVGYANNAYRIETVAGAGNIWTYNTAPGGSDYSVGVDVQVNGDSAGLVLRFVDRNNYLAFTINPAGGGYDLERISGGRSTILATGSAPPGFHTSRGGNNRIVAELDGQTIRLYINGTLVRELERVSDFAGSNRFGMVATGIRENTVALFRNLEIRELP